MAASFGIAGIDDVELIDEGASVAATHFLSEHDTYYFSTCYGVWQYA